MGTLVDWGGPADTPCFGEYPFFCESRLRLEHPEWAPIDRHGFRRQGGPIELAYPKARRALVDLHARHVLKAGYDGMVFLTYAENYSLRFQDEFGFNKPIVEEFKRRYKIDLRSEEFKRFGCRYDWYNLRGEYLTEYLRELKRKLGKHGRKLGLFLNPWEPHYPQPWNVPQLMLTGGRMYMDLERWVRESIADQFIVYGYCDRRVQERTLENCQWMARETATEVSFCTSGPLADCWKPFREKGVAAVIAFGPDEMYLDRSGVAEQPVSSLRSEDLKLKMRALSQVVYGKTKAGVKELAPLTRDPNVIVRRMAYSALGKTKDAEAVPTMERGLDDPEHSVRCAAALAFRDVYNADSTAKLLAAIDRSATHPLCEIVWPTLPRFRPMPRDEVAGAARRHENPNVRMVAMRALVYMWHESVVPTFVAGLQDSDRFVRYAGAKGLGATRRSPRAVEALIAAINHKDVVVANRAAVSLGEVAVRDEKEVAHLRPNVREALTKLFRQFGDGCERADREWGYRSVGNALLDMGGEGEAALREFMAQRSDKRLAELAWMVLELRQRPGTFSEVTERENEEAFGKRPGRE